MALLEAPGISAWGFLFLPALPGGRIFPVLDAGRVVPVGSRDYREWNLPVCLVQVGEQIAGLLEGLGMLFFIGQVFQLMRVLADQKKFLGRTGVGEDLLLLGVGLARGMGLP